jgi:hypothetical protein
MEKIIVSPELKMEAQAYWAEGFRITYLKNNNQVSAYSCDVFKCLAAIVSALYDISYTKEKQDSNGLKMIISQMRDYLLNSFSAKEDRSEYTKEKDDFCTAYFIEFLVDVGDAMSCGYFKNIPYVTKDGKKVKSLVYDQSKDEYVVSGDVKI